MTVLGIPAGAHILVPAYHHGSEVEALLRAGLTCRFYEGSPDLEPDADELESLLDPDTGALHLIHYLGFPQDAPRWRKWCDERGLILIEDAAQSWLSMRNGRPVGSWGDVAIYSLYKSVAVPDGGAVVVKDGVIAEPRPGRGALRPIGRMHLDAFARRPPAASHEEVDFNPEHEFGVPKVGRAASRATLYLLPRLVHLESAVRRRANYKRLLDVAAEMVPSPFERLSNGAAPFMFPVETDDKPALIARLAERGIEGVNMWSRPHPALDPARFSGIADRRHRTVGLPVHQGLRRDDVDRIVAALAAEVSEVSECGRQLA